MQFTGAQATGHHHGHRAQQHGRHQGDDLKAGQQQHQGSNQQRHALAADRGQVLLQLLQDHQVVTGRQAADGVLGPLQQQHIPLTELGAPEPFPQHGIAAPQGQHRGVVALPETQIAQAVTGEGGAGGQQHLHHPLAVVLLQAERLLRRGSQDHCVVLLEAQQVLAAAAQQQTIPEHQGAVGQGRHKALRAAVQLQNVEVKAPLQPRGVERLANELRTQWNLDLGQVSTAGEVSDQVVVIAAPIRQKAIGEQHHQRPAQQPDPQTDRGKAEQAKAAVAQTATDLAGQQVHRAAQQGDRPPEHRGKGQREQHLRRGDPAAFAPALHHRKQACDDRGIGDDRRNGTHHRHHQGNHSLRAANGVGADQGAQTIESPAAEQPSGDGEQTSQGDQGRAAKTLQGFPRLDHVEADQQAGGEQPREIGRQPTGDEEDHGAQQHHQRDQGSGLQSGSNKISQGRGDRARPSAYSSQNTADGSGITAQREKFSQN